MEKNERQQFANAPRRPRSRFTLINMIAALPLFFIAAFCLIALGNMINKSSVGGSDGPVLNVQPGRDSPPPDNRCSLPTERYDVYTGQAACYPSSGGIWMAELSPLELQHLDINRFESTERSSNQGDEDEFCLQLRQLGGSWYNPQSSDDLWVGGECIDLDVRMPTFSVSRQVGFPQRGGVWILALGKDGMYPRGMSTVHNALTMEERCMALERLGAVFCEDIADCPALNDLSKEPCELAEKYGRGHGFCGTE